MARSRRFLFTAPFVMIATLPACKHSTAGGGGGGDDDVTHNPPAQHYNQWNVRQNDGGGCYVDWGDMDCPEGASCNPPPPMAVDCPAGITIDAPITIYQNVEDGPCTLATDGSETPCPGAEVEEPDGGGDDEPMED
jgi:hypothetical protein